MGRLALWLKGDETHPRVRKVDDYGALGRILHFRITSEEDVDPGLLKLLKAAYKVGAQDATAPDRRRVAAKPRRGS